jgi:hypothetical protein
MEDIKQRQQDALNLWNALEAVPLGYVVALDRRGAMWRVLVMAPPTFEGVPDLGIDDPDLYAVVAHDYQHMTDPDQIRQNVHYLRRARFGKAAEAFEQKIPGGVPKIPGHPTTEEFLLLRKTMILGAKSKRLQLAIRHDPFPGEACNESGTLNTVAAILREQIGRFDPATGLPSSNEGQMIQCCEICADDPEGECPCVLPMFHGGSHRDSKGRTWAQPHRQKGLAMTQEEADKIKEQFPGVQLFYSNGSMVYTYHSTDLEEGQAKVITESAPVLLKILNALERLFWLDYLKE